jgi:TolB-like protein/DNA-binding winged helix-turn-helix (wHTH) protein/Tfp pilus assembly protein PilF
MNDRVQKAGVLRFGTFELDLASGELRKDGALVKLQSQHFQLLALLVERAGQVVSREEIRRALWDNETFVDFDRSINFGVNQIRGALDDDPQSPRYIETLPRKGYRFIAPITEAGDERAEGSPAAEPGLVPKPVPARRWWLMSAGVAVALSAIALAVTTSVSRQRGAKPIESLAVLPLENLSHDPEQDYFADGMTDELITDLAKISALRVISRTSVMQYKGTKKPVPQIARELNVDAVLEGTVLRDQGRVRITAQLIGAAPEKHLWAEKYEGSLSEVFTLQDAVAKAVVREIQIKVTPQEQAQLAARRAVNPEAYEAFLRGLYLNPTEENFKKIRDYFQLAVDKDPSYALAWEQLADTYGMMGAYGVLSPKEAYPLIRDANERALKLDPSRSGPIECLGHLKQDYEWDWAGAEREYKRAIELNPRNASALMGYSGFLAEMGRTAEAVAESQRARELAPRIYWPNMQVAWRLYLDHQYEQSELESRKLLEWEPGLPWSYTCQASVHLQTGRQQEAVAELRKSAALPSSGVYELMYLGHALALTGARPEARKVLDQMLSLSKRRYVPPSFIAVVYVGLGDRDRTFEWLEKAFAERAMHSWVLPDPRLDPIRSDPRFQNLMRRMGLPR